MRTTIFYFSGTGNCLKVAGDLVSELDDAEIVSIPKVINREIDCSAERIGIVFPVYIFGMPLLVENFIKRLKPEKDKYIFAVATYGGMAADTLGQAARQLKRQGLKLSAGFLVKMPGNYTPLYEAIPVKKQQKIFAAGQQRIKNIARIV
ncbi:MAG: EFR1 family ferrodoxin, partial [Candidatus Omnitrophota bacterium]|nr:EFR1 family ferrodoxin [Candidatus Omnitrophota bacterium]